MRTTRVTDDRRVADNVLTIKTALRVADGRLW